jgi:hypothetical protein
MGYIALPRETAVIIENAGTAVFFGLVGAFGVWVLIVFFKNLQAFRSGQDPFPHEPAVPADPS